MSSKILNLHILWLNHTAKGWGKDACSPEPSHRAAAKDLLPFFAPTPISHLPKGRAVLSLEEGLEEKALTWNKDLFSFKFKCQRIS